MRQATVKTSAQSVMSRWMWTAGAQTATSQSHRQLSPRTMLGRDIGTSSLSRSWRGTRTACGRWHGRRTVSRSAKLSRQYQYGCSAFALSMRNVGTEDRQAGIACRHAGTVQQQRVPDTASCLSRVFRSASCAQQCCALHRAESFRGIQHEVLLACCKAAIKGRIWAGK